MNKKELRAVMKGLLAGIPAADLTERSRLVARRVADTEAWKRADTVLGFLSMPHELDTADLLAAARVGGKRVAVPLIEGEDIRFLLLTQDPASLPRDRWGIPVPDPSWTELEPAHAGRILVAAPGLAFDRQGNRLGRGKGYYDRFLIRARRQAPDMAVLGVCLSEQIVDAVPHEDHDQPLDGLVTERETLLRVPLP
ncbi:MAG: 5-formyltetrahydrofolate cyclo-ligase [Spirochaetia bacterium]|jgi:5-formyltetrahydrofolate cyclo-ligase